jgi:outer membrane protein assembly factor BamA
MFGPLLLFLAALPIHDIEVHGNKTIPAQAITAASGLKPGQSADKPDFDKACTHILRTGFFVSCNYSFAKAGPGGYQLSLEVTEIEPTQTVRLEIPGLDQQKFREQEPLLAGPKIPATDAAAQTYVTALQRYLKTTESPRVEIDLKHNETVIAFGEGKKVPSRANEPAAGAPEPEKKFTFGELTIKGLPAFTERRVRTLWTIAPGDPIKASTADDFISEVFEAKIVPVEFQDASARTEPRPNSDIADITITFKNGSNRQ